MLKAGIYTDEGHPRVLPGSKFPKRVAGPQVPKKFRI